MIAQARQFITFPVIAAILAVVIGGIAAVLPVMISPVAAAAAVPGIVGVIVLLALPRAGVIAFLPLVTLLPFAVVPIRLGVQLTLLDVMLLALTVGWLMGVAERGERVEIPAAGVALIAFCLIACAAFVVSAPYALTPELARRFLKLMLSTLFFIVALNLVQSAVQLRRHVQVFMICGGVAALIGLVLYFQSPDRQVSLLSRLAPLGYPSGSAILRYLPGPNDTYSNVLRATGTSIDPNVFAGMLVMCLSLVVAQLFASQPVLPRVVLLALLVALAGCLLATQSRATWLGATAALAWLATLRYRKAWILCAIGVVGVLATPVGRSLLARVTSGFEARDKASALRLSEYRNAVEIIQAYPVLGIGFGAAPRLGLFPGVSSQLLLVAEQTGLIGLAAYVGAILAVLVPSVKAALRRDLDDRAGLLTALQAAIIAALVAGILDHYWANQAFPHAVALFWYVCALLVRCTQLTTERVGGETS